MTTDTLLWYNDAHRPLPDAIDAACAAFSRRTGLPPTNVILPVGDALRQAQDETPERVGKLRVETSGLVSKWHLQIYSTYQTGDLICSVCGGVYGNEPAITFGASHGLCLQCQPIEAAKVEVWRLTQVKQLELI